MISEEHGEVLEQMREIFGEVIDLSLLYRDTILSQWIPCFILQRFSEMKLNLYYSLIAETLVRRRQQRGQGS